MTNILPSAKGDDATRQFDQNGVLEDHSQHEGTSAVQKGEPGKRKRGHDNFETEGVPEGKEG